MGDFLLDILSFYKEFCEFSVNKVASLPSISISWVCYIFVWLFWREEVG